VVRQRRDGRATVPARKAAGLDERQAAAGLALGEVLPADATPGDVTAIMGQIADAIREGLGAE